MSEENLIPAGRPEDKSENDEWRVDPDWWKKIFDEVYLLTDARSINDQRLTRIEVDLIEGFLGVARSEPILDLCGGHGRHALELDRRGYTHITTLDYSAYLLAHGKQQAASNVSFVRADARNLPFEENTYRAIVILACSFGYFPDDSENLVILQEAHRVLTPGGKLVLDVCNAEKALESMAEKSWHEADQDVVVLRKRKLRQGGIAVRELVISKRKGLIRESNYFEKLYSAPQLESLLGSAGFGSIKIYCGLEKLNKDQDLGFMSCRMIATACK